MLIKSDDNSLRIEKCETKITFTSETGEKLSVKQLASGSIGLDTGDCVYIVSDGKIS